MPLNPFEAHAVLRSAVAELNPHAVKQAVYVNLRGGLPSSSFSDGRGSAEPPFPGFDRTDAELVAALEGFEADLAEVAEKVGKLVKRQRELLWQKPAPIAKPVVMAALGEESEGAEEKLAWCVSCARVRIGGYPHHSPVADEKRGGKDCTLCRRCLDVYRESGQWPPVEWVRAWAEGRRVTVKVKSS